MAFSGYFEALDLEPTPCGLFSAASVDVHTASNDDERWVRGFDYEIHTAPGLALESLSGAVSGGTISIGSADADDWKTYTPFVVLLDDTHSGFGSTDDLFDDATEVLEDATQKAVELEFWDGIVTTAESSGNAFLASASATVVGSAAASPAGALALIEAAIGEAPLGTQGIIHMTRDVASALGSRLIYKGGKITTRIGTPVVVGSGYSGNGPSGATGAAATATNKWIYATGPISVHVGAKEVLNSDLSQGFNSQTNTLQVVAMRPAAAYFDPITYAAARVDLSAV